MDRRKDLSSQAFRRDESRMVAQGSPSTAAGSLQSPSLQPGTNTLMLFAGMTILAECGMDSHAGPSAMMDPPLPS
jgi:hypothetical protein